LPGYITNGSSLEETKGNIHETIELHLETMREVGAPIPPATTAVDFVEVEAVA
jgi:predicted RNase H-like HicB family nuclease